MQIENKISKYFLALLIVGIVINAWGLFNDILEPDGALYASISKTMAQKNDWINLYAYGNDWLDKPHFPFWITALSIKVFGITSFAYKLPSFICFLISIYYTYKLCLITCSKQTAELACLIYVTSLHIILCNFDVRAEIYLTCFINAAIYFLILGQEKFWFKNILIASIFTALAIMTKGIFVFITIGSGFVVYWILSKQFKQFLQPKWYVYVLLSLVFITPELYCLYQQFDLHPEKIVFGNQNVSGLKFFFWDSQFGRFFNSGPIQGSGDVFFFTHTTLWAFLPWSLFVVLAIVRNIKLIKSFKPTYQTILYASALISFLMFSVSKFQLPHYIVIIFPILSILVANYLRCSFKLKAMKTNQFILAFCFIILCVLISILVYLYQFNYTILLVSFMVFMTFYFIKYTLKPTLFNIVLRGFAFSILLSFFLNIIFYPSIQQYQAGMMAAKWQQKNLKNELVYLYKTEECSFEYYGNTIMQRQTNLTNTLANKNEAKFVSSAANFNAINSDSFNVNVLQKFPYFHITELSYNFLNHKTRASTLDTVCIASVSKKY